VISFGFRYEGARPGVDQAEQARSFLDELRPRIAAAKRAPEEFKQIGVIEYRPGAGDKPESGDVGGLPAIRRQDAISETQRPWLAAGVASFRASVRLHPHWTSSRGVGTRNRGRHFAMGLGDVPDARSWNIQVISSELVSPAHS
jgi:hypothetical protein